MKKVLFVFMMMALVLSACGGSAAKAPEACSADDFGCAVIPEGETIKIGMAPPC